MKRRGTAIGRSLFLKHPSQAGVCYCGFLFSNTALDSIVSLVPRSDPLGPLQKRNYGANKLLYDDAERPPDPKSLLSPDELQERAEMVCFLIHLRRRHTPHFISNLSKSITHFFCFVSVDSLVGVQNIRLVLDWCWSVNRIWHS
jgi:hypothetical protein